MTPMKIEILKKRRNEIHHPQKTKSAQISVEILTKKNFVPENLR